MKTCYSFSEDNNEYTGTSIAFEDPIHEGTFHLPRNAVYDAPPDIPAGQQAVWNPVTQEWFLIADHRGETWYNNHEVVEVKELGDPTSFETPLSRVQAPAPIVVPLAIATFRAKIVFQTTPMPSNPQSTVWLSINAYIETLTDTKHRFMAQAAFMEAPVLSRDGQILSEAIAYMKSIDPKVDDAFIDNLFLESQALKF